MRQQIRRVLGSAVFGLGATLAIAGCGAGQITQTGAHEAAVNGAFGQVGTLLLRDAALNFPEGPDKSYRAGSSAPLTLRVINNGGMDDELLSVTAEGVASATVEGQRRVIAGSVLVIGEPTDGEGEHAGSSSAKPSSAHATPTSTGAAEPTSSGTATASPSESASVTADPETTFEVTSTDSAPSTQESSPAPGVTEPPAEDPTVGEAEVTLQGLAHELRPGQTIKVTFVFRGAGPVTLDMPIGTSGAARVDHHSPEDGEPAEGGH